MQLFDVDCFVGRWTTDDLGCDDTTALDAEMARLGVSRALVRHTWGWLHDPAEGNEALLSLLDGRSDLVPCLAAGPLLNEELGGVDALLGLARSVGAGAVCLYPKSHSYSLAPWCCGQLCEALQAASMPVLLDMEQVSWEELARLLDDWPRLPVVLARTGYRILRNLLPLMRSHANLHVDLAYLGDNEALEVITGQVGAERVLFGSGTPRNDGAGSLARLTLSPLSDGDKALVAAGNLDRLIAGIRLAA